MDRDKIKLNSDEIDFLPLSYCDQRGKLFSFQGKIYRGISESWIDEVYDLFSSGLLEHLTQQGLFPKSEITEYETDKYPIVIEHECINNISYPYEWTFEMLKTAALTTLEVNAICNGYGFVLKDAHHDNIVFEGVLPKFVDLGSIVKRKGNTESWGALERFYQSFIYPLRIWKSCGEFVARRLLMGNEYIPHATFFLINFPMLKFLDHTKLSKILTLWNKYKKIPSLSKEDLERKVTQLPRALEMLFRSLQRFNLLPFIKYKHAMLKRKVERIKRQRPFSIWSDYHTNVVDEVGNINAYTRFREIINTLKLLKCRTVTELGANQGELSRMILAETGVSRISCLDIDEGALDIAFCKDYSARHNITHAVVDIMAPMTTYPKELPHYRFKAEAVVALALTHHLTLGQGYEINSVVGRIREYTTKYALIEFMPFGFDMTFKGVGVPSWYTEEWFKSAFEKKFRILERKQLEPNRILYIGEVKERK